MRVVFMGTPEASVPSLEAVCRSFDLVAVYTRGDRPRGRGRQVSASPVKEAASALGVPVVQPRTLRDDAEVARLRELAPEAVAVVAYGMILPPGVLETPRLGCVNVHFSLLPRWRGAAPVQRAILAGDDQTGVTTMLMDEGLDTGPVLSTEAVEIGGQDTAGSVTERLATLGAELLVDTLRGLDRGEITPRPQPPEGATRAPRVTAEEAELDPSRPAVELERVVRAMQPAPGAWLWFRQRRLKVHRTAVVGGEGPPGVLAWAGPEGLDVQTVSGRLRLLEVQPEGKRPMAAADFARGARPEVGETMGR